MSDQGINFIYGRLWNRQSELLAEAQGIRDATLAIRANRLERERGRLSAARTASNARRPGAGRKVATKPLIRTRRGWRGAAAHMGRSLVAVGRRLETLSEAGGR